MHTIKEKSVFERLIKMFVNSNVWCGGRGGLWGRARGGARP